MPGWIELRVNVIKNGMETYNIKKNPAFKPGPVMPNYTDYIVFEGISVNEFSGKQTYLDANTAYRNACLNAIEFKNTWVHRRTSLHATWFCSSPRNCCWYC